MDRPTEEEEKEEVEELYSRVLELIVAPEVAGRTADALKDDWPSQIVTILNKDSRNYISSVLHTNREN